jgi:hypothetical protein
MQDSQMQISEADAAKILTIATHLHARNQRDYSFEEIIKVGEEVNIPPSHIYQALLQIQTAKATPYCGLLSSPKSKPGYLLPLLGAIAGLLISIPLYPATKSGQYASTPELIGMEMLTTAIRISPVGLGVLFGILVNQKMLQRRR